MLVLNEPLLGPRLVNNAWSASSQLVCCCAPGLMLGLDYVLRSNLVPYMMNRVSRSNQLIVSPTQLRLLLKIAES